jgi:hypothetical protein
MREPRLGDDLDDFCVRCKRIMNHAIVSVLNGEPAKVRCRTCHNDHDYRHEQPPPPKVDLRKQALFNEALKKINPTAAADAEAVGEVELEPDDLAVEEALPGMDLETDAEPAVAEEVAEAAAEEVTQQVAEEPVAPPKAAAKPPAKPKAKSRKTAK